MTKQFIVTSVITFDRDMQKEDVEALFKEQLGKDIHSYTDPDNQDNTKAVTVERFYVRSVDEQ